MNLYKLNKDYINSFQKNVINRYNKDDKRSETSFLGSVLKEINELFRKIGGQLSSKRNIPKEGEYPNSSKYNALVEDIGFDIDKIYNAQTLVESDVKNLINFNAIQRDKIFENLMNAQQIVFSVYMKSKKDLISGIEVPANNPFSSSIEATSKESKDVYVDSDIPSLTLSSTTSITRNIDTNFVNIYLSGPEIKTVMYPINSNKAMGIGSHWKLETGKDPHFIDQTNNSEVTSYKKMMIDDPNSNTGVGFCEFEIVETIKNSTLETYDIVEYRRLWGNIPHKKSISREITDVVLNVKKELGIQLGGYDNTLIYMDEVNSLQGKYNRFKNIKNELDDTSFKLVIPFTSNILTNEFVVDFTGSNGHIPEIDWEASSVYSNDQGSDKKHSFVNGNKFSQDGRFICKTIEFINPSRAELIIKYSINSLIMSDIPFVMSHYLCTTGIPYEMQTNTASKVKLTIKKTYNVFVDSGNERDEQTRAFNVLTNPNKTGV